MANMNISDLPPKYQVQALAQLAEQERRRALAKQGQAPPPQEPGKPAKYRNQKTDRIMESGAALHFDSQKEARRFDHLILRELAGEISDLRLQVDFTLQEAYTDTQGQRIRAIRYKADFTYWERGAYVVEDVKSKPTRTREYIMKRKLMKDRLGIDVIEV